MSAFDTISPYAEGKWMNLEINKTLLTSESSSSEDSSSDSEDEGKPKIDCTLRGPCWNYGRKILANDEQYYAELLYGQRFGGLKSPDELILKGQIWTPRKPVTTSFIVHFLKRLKSRNPTTIALHEIETGRKLTYDELIKKAQSIACGLRWLGVKAGHVITVVSFNSIEAHLIYFASLLVGAIIAIADADLNAVDLGALLRISLPRLVFSEAGSTLKKVQTAITYMITTDKPMLVVNKDLKEKSKSFFTFQQLLRDVEPDFEPTYKTLDPDRPMMLLFTSGTTSFPKAALLSERFFMNSKQFLESQFTIRGISMVVLVTSPMCWITMIMALLINISDGHKCVFFRGPPPVACLLETLYKLKVCMWVTSPTNLMSLLNWPLKPRCPHLMHIYVSGMQFTYKNIISVRDQVFDGKVPILQIYGMTETGCLTSNSHLCNKYGSIGKVFYNTQMKVVEELTGLCLGPGQEGELRFKNDTMMRCYYKNPEATEEIFDSEGFIRTGDLGYYDNEGFVYFSGRIKSLIKWKSYQITPAAVEQVILTQPQVMEAMVFGLPDEVCGELVTAAVVFRPQFKDTDPKIIEESANRLLSNSKRIRGGVHVFQNFPCTSSGKPIRTSILQEVVNRRNTSDEELSYFDEESLSN